MLKLAEEKDKNSLLDFCRESVMGARISGYVESYGFGRDFLMLWVEKKDNRLVCAVAKFYDSVTLKADDDADFSEISDFLNMLGFDFVTCENSVAKKLGFTDYSVKTALKYCQLSCVDSSDVSSCHELKEAYLLISKSIPNSFKNSDEAYLSWLSDFTFRCRRNCGRIKAIHENDELVSCALTSAESESQAIISGVACKSGQRKSGYGKRTVCALADELKNENKDVYVIALNDSAIGFYEKIGFEESEKIAFVKG